MSFSLCPKTCGISGNGKIETFLGNELCAFLVKAKFIVLLDVMALVSPLLVNKSW